RIVALVDDDPAVVTVESGLDAVRRREHRRHGLERERRRTARATGHDVVGVPLADARLYSSRERRARRRIARAEDAVGRARLAGHALGAVVRIPDAISPPR